MPAPVVVAAARRRRAAFLLPLFCLPLVVGCVLEWVSLSRSVLCVQSGNTAEHTLQKMGWVHTIVEEEEEEEEEAPPHDDDGGGGGERSLRFPSFVRSRQRRRRRKAGLSTPDQIGREREQEKKAL